jgi:hypothetical protein
VRNFVYSNSVLFLTRKSRQWLARKTKQLRGLSQRAKYTDRATAACRRSLCQPLRIEGATWSAWRIPTAVFLDRSRYFFSQVATQLYSRGWLDPVPKPLLLRKSINDGNRTRSSEFAAKSQRRSTSLIARFISDNPSAKPLMPELFQDFTEYIPHRRWKYVSDKHQNCSAIWRPIFWRASFTHFS